MWRGERLQKAMNPPGYRLCCYTGSIHLPPSSQLPPLLQGLLDGSDPRGVHFLHHVRAYNSAFALASLQVNMDHSVAKARAGIYTFRACGSIYHNIGPLRSAQGPRSASFGQIYFYDETEQLQRRSTLFEGLNNSLLQDLHRMMVEVNPFVRTFKTAAERYAIVPMDRCRSGSARTQLQVVATIYRRSRRSLR